MATMLYFFLLLCSALAAPNPRVFGGKTATPGQFPFVVSLNNPDQFCDGSIINSNWIVTAAHCMKEMTYTSTVLTGTIYQQSGGTTYNISKTVQHEDFNEISLENDIALVKIDGEFLFNDEVQVAEFGTPEVNATCEVVGWGETEKVVFPDELKFVEVVALSDEQCHKMVDGIIDPSLYLGPQQVCGYGPDGKGACFGDSGGPLVCGGKLVGVVSYGIVACAAGVPDVYTRLMAYSEWIETQLNI